jgi:hypothetical protein
MELLNKLFMIATIHKKEDIIDLFTKIICNWNANKYFSDNLITMLVNSKCSLLNDLFS